MRYSALSILLILLVVIMIHHAHPNRPFFQSWESSKSLCEQFCDSQGHLQVKRDSLGGCMCDNEEGRKMDRGYLSELNGNCEDKD